MKAKKDEKYSGRETRQRAETALRAAFAKPFKPQAELKLGKQRASKKASRKS